MELVVERRRKVSWNMIIGKLELHIILSYVMELLFFGIIGVLQVQRVTKLSRQQNLSLYMDATTNGAASHPKIESFFSPNIMGFLDFCSLYGFLTVLFISKRN
jgi:hypothetical protein